MGETDRKTTERKRGGESGSASQSHSRDEIPAQLNPPPFSPYSTLPYHPMGTPIERVSGGRTDWTGMARIREPWESLELLLAKGRDKRAVTSVIGHLKLASRTREPMWFSVTHSIPFMPGHLQSFFSPPTAEEEREARRRRRCPAYSV
jgi:hypothetical protein